MNNDYRKGLIAFKEGRFQDAINIFTVLIEINRNDATVWHALGASYAKINKIPEAYNCILFSTRIEPDNKKFQKSLSIITKKLENFTKTTEYKENYIEKQKKEKVKAYESLGKGIVYIILFLFVIYLIINVSIPSFFILTEQNLPNSQFEKFSIDQLQLNSKEIPYETLLRNPTAYKGYLLRIYGQIKQMIPINEKSVDLLISTKVLVGGNKLRDTVYSDDIMYVRYKGQNVNKILEDDIVTVYGEYNGRITYQTYLGSKTVPDISAIYIEIPGESYSGNIDSYQNTQQISNVEYSAESIDKNKDIYHPSLSNDEISSLKSKLKDQNENFLPIAQIYGDWNNNQIENIFFEMEVPADKTPQNIEGMKIAITTNNQEPIELHPTYEKSIINPGEKQKISVNLEGYYLESNDIILFGIRVNDDLPLWFSGEIVPDYTGGVIYNLLEF